MKPERLEELVASCYALETNISEQIRSALLAVERETVERCAKVCVGERLADADAKLPIDRYYNMACSDCAEKVRALVEKLK